MPELFRALQLIGVFLCICSPAVADTSAPLPEPEPKEHVLGLRFTFANEADCETKLANVTSATVEIPDGFTQATYCGRLFPLGEKELALNVELPAKFTFTDESGCESNITSDLVACGASVIFPERSETARQYCENLFPPKPAPQPIPPVQPVQKISRDDSADSVEHQDRPAAPPGNGNLCSNGYFYGQETACWGVCDPLPRCIPNGTPGFSPAK